MLRFARYTLLVALAVAVLGYGAVGCKDSGANGKKVLVLGCDGMDPKLVARLMAAGRMPHFAKLAAQGGFKPLTTSIPPQSPVAWSNFITGAGPGVHGIFDFIHRDPARQCAPYFSTSLDVPGAEPLFKPEIGGYQFNSQQFNPFAKTAHTELARRGTPFWDFLDARSIPVFLYRMPANYPPSKSPNGHQCCLCDMGTPDALGTQGTYQHFSTRPRAESDDVGGGMQFRIRTNFDTGGKFARLRGPHNEYLPPQPGKSDPPQMTLDINIYPDKDRDVAKIVYVNQGITGDTTVDVVLNVGEWSDWTEVHFRKTPIGPVFPTMVRFYLQGVRPDIDLYVSPLNFVPTAPAAIISEPPKFVEEVGKRIGPFYTQGFAESFKARDTGVFNDAEYKIQADIVLAERMKLMNDALSQYKDGLLFFYFSSSDLQSHIFWWDNDDPHPCRSPEEAKKYQHVVEDLYTTLDGALGKCMEKLGDDTTIIVMSDHGFCNFRRGFGLNTWLREQGYLAATDDLKTDADWSKSRAYGMGLNGLYINLKGRERDGIVEPAQRDALLREISEKLLAYVDKETGRHPVKRVYRTDEVYQGPEAAKAPDLIIGYDRDYRASWNTCLGGFDKAVVIDNKNAWSADHCIAHDVVPGILLTNRRIVADEPALVDIAPTVLGEFGIATPSYMTGRNIFAPTQQIAAKVSK